MASQATWPSLAEAFAAAIGGGATAGEVEPSPAMSALVHAPLALAGLAAILWISQPSIFWAPCPILSALLQP